MSLDSAPAPPFPSSTQAPSFSAGSVISRSFSVWFSNFVPFSIVTLAVNLPILALAAVAPEVGGPGWRVLDSALSMLAQFVVTGALTKGVLESLRGGRAPIGTLFGTGFRKVGWVFAVSFRVGIWVFLGTLLLVVPGIVWYCALFVAVPAVVVESGLGSADALQRSRDLTQGDRWGIFTIVVVSFVLAVAMTAVVAALLAFAEALPPPIPIVLATAIVALASTFGAITAAVAYHDLRVVKEGAATEDLAKVFE